VFPGVLIYYNGGVFRKGSTLKSIPNTFIIGKKKTKNIRYTEEYIYT